MAINTQKFDVAAFEYHPKIEQLTKLVAARSNSNDYHFIRTAIAFYLGIITSTQRISVSLAGDRPVPLNIYAVALARSGAGKGVITGTLEDLLKPLTTTFNDTWLRMREERIEGKAQNQATANGTEIDEELAEVRKETYKLGVPVVWFEEGTSPAVKQMRTALLKVPYGSINLIVDEVFAAGEQEVMNDMVKSYDDGKLKQKLIKHSTDTPRVIDPPTSKCPAQMLLFGTGDQLDNPNVYDRFASQLGSGLARRCLFAYSPEIVPQRLTALQRYENLTTKNSKSLFNSFEKIIEGMLSTSWYKTKLTMNKPTHLYLLEYENWCIDRAADLANPILQAEMTHRYMKTIKFAGILAVWDGSGVVTVKHLQQSIKFIEDGGASITKIVRNTPLHVRLAEFLARGDRMTTSQLVIELPWFGKLTKFQKAEHLQLAVEYGYANSIIIHQETIRGIDYIEGNLITPTDLSKMVLSLSNHQAYGYQNGHASWEKLHEIICDQGIHWVNHHFTVPGHRNEDSVIDGFNMVVLDVDNGPKATSNISIEAAKQLLNQYKFMIYESKSSTEQFNRYRIVLPMSHLLQLPADVFTVFMRNVYEWLPFDVDEATAQRSRKWLGYDKSYFYHDGDDMLPALEFIPDTEPQLQHASQAAALKDLNGIDRWFVTNLNNTPTGRNNGLHRYALLLLDANIAQVDVENAVLKLNKALTSPLEESEIRSTIFTSIAKKLSTKP